MDIPEFAKMVESLIKYTQSAAVNPTLTLIFSGVYRGLENKLSVQNKVYLSFSIIRNLFGECR